MSLTKSNSIATKIAIGAIGVAFVFGLLFAAATPAQAALTQSQVDSIIALLESFGASPCGCHERLRLARVLRG